MKKYMTSSEIASVRRRYGLTERYIYDNELNMPETYNERLSQSEIDKIHKDKEEVQLALKIFRQFHRADPTQVIKIKTDIFNKDKIGVLLGLQPEIWYSTDTIEGSWKRGTIYRHPFEHDVYLIYIPSENIFVSVPTSAKTYVSDWIHG
jgi:hypothetical protein